MVEKQNERESPTLITSLRLPHLYFLWSAHGQARALQIPNKFFWVRVGEEGGKSWGCCGEADGLWEKERGGKRVIEGCKLQ